MLSVVVVSVVGGVLPECAARPNWLEEPLFLSREFSR